MNEPQTAAGRAFYHDLAVWAEEDGAGASDFPGYRAAILAIEAEAAEQALRASGEREAALMEVWSALEDALDDIPEGSPIHSIADAMCNAIGDEHATDPASPSQVH